MESKQVVQGIPPREKHKHKGSGLTNTYKGRIAKNKKGKDHKGRSRTDNTMTQGQVDKPTPINSILRYFSSNAKPNLECE